MWSGSLGDHMALHGVPVVLVSCLVALAQMWPLQRVEDGLWANWAYAGYQVWCNICGFTVFWVTSRFAMASPSYAASFCGPFLLCVGCYLATYTLLSVLWWPFPCTTILSSGVSFVPYSVLTWRDIKRLNRGASLLGRWLRVLFAGSVGFVSVGLGVAILAPFFVVDEPWQQQLLLGLFLATTNAAAAAVDALMQDMNRVSSSAKVRSVGSVRLSASYV